MRLKRVISIGMSGDDITLLQEKLKDLGFFKERIDGYFGQNTLVAVTSLQRSLGIKPDGVVSAQTWSQIINYGVPRLKSLIEKPSPIIIDVREIPYNSSYIGSDGLIIYDCLLSDDEYVKTETQKNTIWLHHSGGNSRPDWTINGWEKENGLKVGTHFVIGRKSSSSDAEVWDGKVLKAIDDRYWSNHLRIETNSEKLNSRSIGIELCNYGPLTLGKDGNFYNSINKQVNKEDVAELETEFRGYKYWEKYTDSQLESLYKLITFLQKRWLIQIESGIYNEDWFNYDEKWFSMGGLRNHSQVRTDKFDLFPQKELIDMLNRL
jgi:hypothetical protein